MPKSCNGVYEAIAKGDEPARMIHTNFRHGLFTLLDPYPVAEGHLVVATLVCAQSADKIPSPALHDKLMTMAKYAGLVLATVYPDAPYIAELAAHNQIRHPHIHRAPGDEEANCLKRFGKADGWPRLELTDIQMDDIQHSLDPRYAGQEVKELWANCDRELTVRSGTDMYTQAALEDLGIRPL